MNTELLYMTDGQKIKHSTEILELIDDTTIILPETIFYPQGGGQPYDQGEIVGENGTFTVSEVRNIDGIVHHIGVMERGSLKPGEPVTLRVNAERRQLHSKLHSAGHLIDLAVHGNKLGWVPGKGYSFPEGAYVEYSGAFDPSTFEELKSQLEIACAQLIAQDLPITIEFMDRSAMEERLHHVPEHLPENRPVRVVFMGEYGIPCGGTHVQSLQELQKVTVRKMKMNGQSLRVSYELHES